MKNRQTVRLGLGTGALWVSIRSRVLFIKVCHLTDSPSALARPISTLGLGRFVGARRLPVDKPAAPSAMPAMHAPFNPIEVLMEDALCTYIDPLDELKAFNRLLSPAVAVLLNEVNEPIATHEPGSKLQRGLVLKLPPQLAPARLIAKQSIASPLTPARPSRKNKPQRCSNCKGTGHKSRTCKWGKPASASIAATVNVAAAPPALLDNNALAMNTAAAAAR